MFDDSTNGFSSLPHDLPTNVRKYSFRTFTIKIFKNLNILNPEYMKAFFKLFPNYIQRFFDIPVNRAMRTKDI